MSHQGFIPDFLDGMIVFPGDDQDMHRRLGMEVFESDDPVIFKQEFFRDFTPGNFAKDTITQWLLLCAPRFIFLFMD